MNRMRKEKLGMNRMVIKRTMYKLHFAVWRLCVASYGERIATEPDSLDKEMEMILYVNLEE